MFGSLAGLFKISELKNKILFTLGMLALFRLGAHIPVPGIDLEKLSRIFKQGGLFDFLDLFSGGAMATFSIFSLGIMPYINASIIMQLLMSVFPKLKEIAEEGETGRKQIAQYTRYLSVALALVQALSISFWFRETVVAGYNFTFFVVTAGICLVAGAVFVMWMGELMTESGIGNGASVLIFVGIVARIPYYIGRTILLIQGGASVLGVIFLILVFLGVIVGIIVVQEGQRKIPVQYAKKIVGRKVYGGQNTFIPLRINQGGVLPIIFASALMQFPLMIVRMIPNQTLQNLVQKYFNYDSVFYMGFFCLLIFFFTYFYTALTFEPNELSENIKKHGGFILGVRPGRPTAEYLEKIISRLTLVGAFFLAVIALIPVVAANLTHISSFQGLGGTALLIVVGVALDIIKQVETHLVARQYESLLK
jgi:preprotein translocase subunit SecY